MKTFKIIREPLAAPSRNPRVKHTLFENHCSRASHNNDEEQRCESADISEVPGRTNIKH